MRARRFWATLGSFALVAGVAAPSTAADPPKTMAALGDSITVAYDATSLLAAQPEYSWSTGYSTSVRSLSQRLSIPRASAVNIAKSGTKMKDLAGQASSASLVVGTDLVTILMGANDACTSAASTMTTKADFRRQFQAALATLASKDVDRIVVASIPNIEQLWSLYKGSGSARFVWGLYKICQSMLANPTSTQTADVQRRAAVTQRVGEFNTVLKEECDLVVACDYDEGLVNSINFGTGDVSKVDYFHPSIQGQGLLATTTAKAFGFPPG
jgi:lysophospholipase L1-like esterase